MELTAEIQKEQQRVREQKFWDKSLQALRSMHNDYKSIVCLALGSPYEDKNAKIQLAYLDLVSKEFGSDVGVWDPQFSQKDVDYLVEFGYTVDKKYGLDLDIEELDKQRKDKVNETAGIGVAPQSAEGLAKKPAEAEAEAQSSQLTEEKQPEAPKAAVPADPAPVASAQCLFFLPHIPLLVLEKFLEIQKPEYLVTNDLVLQSMKTTFSKLSSEHPIIAKIVTLLDPVAPKDAPDDEFQSVQRRKRKNRKNVVLDLAEAQKEFQNQMADRGPRAAHVLYRFESSDMSKEIYSGMNNLCVMCLQY